MTRWVAVNGLSSKSDLLGGVAREQEAIRRQPGARALSQLVDSVTALTGAEVVAVGLFESAGVLRVTAHAGTLGARPEVLTVHDGRIVDAAAVCPGVEEALWAPLQVGADVLGGVVLLHSAPLPAFTAALVQILAAMAADMWERPAPSIGAAQDVQDSSPFGISTMDLGPTGAGRLLRANQTLADMLGYQDPSELVGLTVRDWTPPEEVAESEHRLRRLGAGRVLSSRYTKNYRRRDGSIVPAIVTSYVVGLDGPSPMLISHVLDATRHWSTAEQLSRSERQFRAAFEEAPYGMLLVSGQPDTLGGILRVNRAFAELTGRSGRELVGTGAVDLLTPADRAGALRTLRRVRGTGQADLSARRQLVRPDGQVVDVVSSTALVSEGPHGPVLICHVQDITQARRQAEELARLAHTDALTGLANRTQLQHWLDEFGQTEARGTYFGIDLNRFKSVNDRFGHRVGDELLVGVSQRLTSADPHWRVCRLGGDEFVVLAPAITTIEQARDEGEGLDALLSAPFDLPSGVTVSVTVGIGAAVHEPGLTGEEVQRRAELALRRAKRGGRTWVSVCDSEVLAQAQELRSKESALRDALARGAIDAWLQPIVDLRSGRVTAYEALARATDADGVVIPAQEFVQVAENTGLISEVDHLVVAAVGRLLAEDRRLGDPRLKVAINVSSQTFTQPSFLRLLARTLGDERPRLVLEVTEHSLLEDDPQVRLTFDWLREVGIELAVDDFGTGYSALAYLRRFKMQHLKVDRAFVQGLGRDRGATSTVRAVIDMAHAHDMSVVAEGIETREQAAELLAMGADLGQGYYFGRPAPRVP